jgi:hypothetical protein
VKATRRAFHLVQTGDALEGAFKAFVPRPAAVLDDEALLKRMEKALEGLAAETSSAARGRSVHNEGAYCR